MNVPFFRPAIGDREVAAVVECLRSGWLTTGAICKQFEQEFAAFVGAKHAVAVNSCTAALHLALDAIGLQRGDVVLVPTMTFAATAEVVRYFDATPVFVDCDRETLCIDHEAAARTVARIREGHSVPGLQRPHGPVRAIMPVHYGGQMCDVDRIRALASEYGLAVIEDAAHTLPAYFRRDPGSPWRAAGTTADVTCFSFYANKCITTGEGGMAVTDDDRMADRMRLMSLHGMSKDAWKRYTASGSWYYEIVAAGFKYNLTDLAAALGRVQLERANDLWEQRRALVAQYHSELGGVPGIELPSELPDRRHAWHLFSAKLDLGVWRGGRDNLIEALKARGIATSVHYQPLHMQPYYRDKFGLAASDCPIAHALWPRLLSLPLFPGMTREEVTTVASAFKTLL